MKPRKSHKRSLRTTILKALTVYSGGVNAYELAHVAKMVHSVADCSVMAVRITLNNLMVEGLIKNGGKRKCHECHTSQTIYKLSID